MNQHLVVAPGNPMPPRASVTCLYTGDAVRLRAATFMPAAQPRATVVILQGRSEFIEKYFETINELLTRNFCVATFDWRGQGGSQRQLDNQRKGHIEDFALYQRDLAACLRYLDESHLPKPWYALAHSMGGAILLEHCCSARSPFRRLVLTAPMLDIALSLPGAARSLATTLNFLGLGERFIPFGKSDAPLEGTFANNKLTSDKDRFARCATVLKKAPWLAIGAPTIAWVNAAFEQIRRLAALDPAFMPCQPGLIVCGEGDRIVSSPAIAAFAQCWTKSQVVPISGARHEILIERDQYRAQFWTAFDAFVA